MDYARQDMLNELAGRLGHTFRDLAILDRALQHSSFVHENPDAGGESNERLEFLGDAVLELVITEFLFERFPDSSEGQLSKARSGVVNEHRLAATAGELDLGAYLRLGKGEESQGGRSKASILADALEAVIASIYLDAGLEKVRQVLHRLLVPAAEQAIKIAPHQDFKTRLQEKVQEALHIAPRYQLQATMGPDHDKTFQVTVLISGRAAAQGVGKSKKEAEQEAARRCLQSIEAGAPLQSDG